MRLSPMPPAPGPSSKSAASSPTPAPAPGDGFSDRAARARRLPARPETPTSSSSRDTRTPTRPRAHEGHRLLVGDEALLAKLGLEGSTSAKPPSREGTVPRPPTAPRGIDAALHACRTGRAPDGSAFLHATVSPSPHARFAGVELRAVEQHGRVTIQLVAPDAASERVLRAAMSDLRSVLITRGLEHVQLDLTASTTPTATPYPASKREPHPHRRDGDHSSEELEPTRPSRASPRQALSLSLDAFDPTCW